MLASGLPLLDGAHVDVQIGGQLALGPPGSSAVAQQQVAEGLRASISVPHLHLKTGQSAV